MEAEKILILYLKNGNVKSEISKEILYDKLIFEMEEEGRKLLETINSDDLKTVTFDDGSKIYLAQFGRSPIGMRLTRIYVDENVASIPKGKNIIYEAYAFTLKDSKNIFSFGYDDKEFYVKRFKKEG